MSIESQFTSSILELTKQISVLSIVPDSFDSFKDFENNLTLLSDPILHEKNRRISFNEVIIASQRNDFTLCIIIFYFLKFMITMIIIFVEQEPMSKMTGDQILEKRYKTLYTVMVETKNENFVLKKGETVGIIKRKEETELCWVDNGGYSIQYIHLYYY